ncbi:uncharacterized protein YciI [Thalassospira sp. MBR-102]|jgi:uncharacterized protein YciI|uniref:YciI family protein n=1 Tax=Thalassospira sp. MBR-102 TaxID=3156466 RepID=UPI0033977889
MFTILLTFSENRAKASQFMEGHKRWISQGFDEGVFLVVGNLQPSRGGGILAHNTTMEELTERLNADPFVIEKIVEAEIIEITPARMDERLEFLKA